MSLNAVFVIYFNLLGNANFPYVLLRVLRFKVDETKTLDTVDQAFPFAFRQNSTLIVFIGPGFECFTGKVLFLSFLKLVS